MRLILFVWPDVLNSFKLVQSTYLAVCSDLDKIKKLFRAALTTSRQALCLLGVIVSQFTPELALCLLRNS